MCGFGDHVANLNSMQSSLAQPFTIAPYYTNTETEPP